MPDRVPGRLAQRFVDAVRLEALWAPGDRVALAVSGGGDSLAMLELAVATRALHGAELAVITVHHGQSGAADAWCEAARARAAHHGLPSQTVRLDLEPGASEDVMRRARYAAFAELDTDCIALGHHQRDQAETVLIHLLRGTGPRGMRGIPVRRDRFVRPVLGFSPESLGQVLAAVGITPCEDPANRDPDFLRVRVRTELLPLLEGIREGSTAALARSASLFARDEVLLQQLAQTLPPDVGSLRDAPSPLARRRVEHLIGPCTTGQIDAVMRCVRAGRGEVQLDPRRRVVVTADGVLTLLGEEDAHEPG